MTMTARRNDNGDLEVIKIGGNTYTYRAILILILLSLTPVGNGIWSLMGMSAPNGTGPNSNVEKRLTTVETKVDAVEEKVEDIRSDVAEIKYRFTGFLVDFDKYRKETK